MPGCSREQLATHPRFRDYLTPERIELLSSLAPLHDIGKVGVPDRVLNKPGALTPDELAEMRKHPAHGRDVIVQAERRAGVAGRCHSGDGQGDRLHPPREVGWHRLPAWPARDEQIPIPGRVMALVDVYDAVVTRNAVPAADDARARRSSSSPPGKGTHFDPAVVEAFVVVAPVFGNLSTEADS